MYTCTIYKKFGSDEIAEWPFLGKLLVRCILFLACLSFVIFAVSNFGCESRILVLIVSVTGHCCQFTFG